MAITIQTVRSLIVTALFLASTSNLYAAVLSRCGEGDIKVGAKTLGKALLWMQDCKQPWQQQTLRLQFSYSAAIPAWAFKKAANVILARNLSDDEWKLNKRTFEQITQQYRPIKAGDVYQLDYDVATQTLGLSLNAQPQGKIQGDMAKQYFLIWFGEKPFNLELKKQLLG